MQAPEKLYRPFTAADWIYEIKWDGWRCRAGFGGGLPVEMYTKSGQSCAGWFPEVVEVLGKLPGGYWAVDGELCVLDSTGRSDFDKMQERASRRRWVAGLQVTYMVFDLTVMNGESVMHLPLMERKALLAGALAQAGKTTVLYQGEFPAQAELLQQMVEPLGLEGFMAKKADAPYISGARSDTWRKIKSKTWIERFRYRFGGHRRKRD
jgi:bifunctional non-homologous end joining protein LigD